MHSYNDGYCAKNGENEFEIYVLCYHMDLLSSLLLLQNHQFSEKPEFLSIFYGQY